MNIGDFEDLDLKLNDAVVTSNESGDDTKGFYLGEYNAENKTFAFSNFANGQIEVILIEKLRGLKKL